MRCPSRQLNQCRATVKRAPVHRWPNHAVVRCRRSRSASISRRHPSIKSPDHGWEPDGSSPEGFCHLFLAAGGLPIRIPAEPIPVSLVGGGDQPLDVRYRLLQRRSASGEDGHASNHSGPAVLKHRQHRRFSPAEYGSPSRQCGQPGAGCADGVLAFSATARRSGRPSFRLIASATSWGRRSLGHNPADRLLGVPSSSCPNLITR